MPASEVSDLERVDCNNNMLLTLNMWSETLLIQTLRGAIESVRITRVEFRENISVYFPQGQSKLSVIMRRPNQAGVCKVGFDCIYVSFNSYKNDFIVPV